MALGYHTPTHCPELLPLPSLDYRAILHRWHFQRTKKPWAPKGINHAGFSLKWVWRDGFRLKALLWEALDILLNQRHLSFQKHNIFPLSICRYIFFKHQIDMHLGISVLDLIYHDQIHQCFSFNLQIKMHKLWKVSWDLVNSFGENSQTIDYKTNHLCK